MASELENYFRDRSLDSDSTAGAFAVAYAMVRLASSLDELTRSFAPQGLGTFETDYFLVRLARRLDELAKQLDAAPLAALAPALAAALNRQAPADPPEAAEFLSRRHNRLRQNR